MESGVGYLLLGERVLGRVCPEVPLPPSCEHTRLGELAAIVSENTQSSLRPVTESLSDVALESSDFQRSLGRYHFIS